MRHLARDVLLVIAALNTACTNNAAVPEASPSLIDGARAVVTVHCGVCHTPSLATAVPGALAVFSLAEPYWFDRMSDRRLQRSVEMLRDRTTATDDELRELRGGAPLIRPSAAEVDVYARFVRSELARRASADTPAR